MCNHVCASRPVHVPGLRHPDTCTALQQQWLAQRASASCRCAYICMQCVAWRSSVESSGATATAGSSHDEGREAIQSAQSTAQPYRLPAIPRPAGRVHCSEQHLLVASSKHTIRQPTRPALPGQPTRLVAGGIGTTDLFMVEPSRLRVNGSPAARQAKAAYI